MIFFAENPYRQPKLALSAQSGKTPHDGRSAAVGTGCHIKNETAVIWVLTAALLYVIMKTVCVYYICMKGMPGYETC